MKHPGSHILIVDDEEQFAETFKDALEDSGYVCYTAACGEAALQILNTEAVDLALLDIMMPGMSGISLFHEMKEQYPEVATIFITAVDDLGTVVSNLKDGASDYLTKPVRFKRLRTAVQEALCKRETMLAENADRGDLEERLLSQAKELEAQGRFRTLGEMAGGVVHDFNNALARIMGFSELLLYRPEYVKERGKERVYLERLHASAEDASSVVKRLQEFYRQRDDSQAFAPVDVNELVETVVGLTEPKWRHQALDEERTIRMETMLEVVPRINGNAPDLREALTNLIFNAVDAILKKPDTGSANIITIQTTVVKKGSDRQSERIASRTRCSVMLRVSDTGTGMTDDIRERCMEPLVSTKGMRAPAWA